MIQNDELEGARTKPVFLATTALEEFWDLSMPVVLLSASCGRFSRRPVWKPLVYDVLPCLLRDQKRFDDAYQYLNGVYESLLPLYGEALNVLHHQKRSNHYWRIVIGPWLFQYIHVLYDRFIHIHQALERYPNLTTRVMSPESFITPRDTAHYDILSVQDSYNLQIYSRILSFLGVKYPSKKYSYANEFRSQNDKKSLRGLLKEFPKGVLNFLRHRLQGRAAVVMVNPYFSFIAQLQLLLKSFGEICIFSKEKLIVPDQPIDDVLRSQLAEVEWGRTEFENLLTKMIPFDVPQSFVENYEFVKKQAEQAGRLSNQVICSTICWYNFDDFKHWVAASAESGAKLVGIQHGGNYGSAKYIWDEHEYAITDYFCSWGWVARKGPSYVVPLPATKMVGRKMLGACLRQRGVLFVTKVVPRYFRRLHQWNQGTFEDYQNWQIRFVHALDDSLRQDLKIRFQRDDYGWDLRQRWEDAGLSGAQIDRCDQTFYKELKKCRLYVGDHLATTFVESLAANKPTILFWDPKLNSLVPEAERFYQGLFTVGILYDSPEAAASAVNQVYENIEVWWNDSQRQKVRAEFCHRFGRTSRRPLREWMKQLEVIARGREGPFPNA